LTTRAHPNAARAGVRALTIENGAGVEDADLGESGCAVGDEPARVAAAEAYIDVAIREQESGTLDAGRGESLYAVHRIAVGGGYRDVKGDGAAELLGTRGDVECVQAESAACGGRRLRGNDVEGVGAGIDDGSGRDTQYRLDGCAGERGFAGLKERDLPERRSGAVVIGVEGVDAVVFSGNVENVMG
jgi:hypothetical protein